MSNTLTLNGDADGNYDVDLEGDALSLKMPDVAVTINPYVAPPPPAPPAAPAALKAVSMALTPSSTTATVGDIITLAAVLTMSDGTTKPVTAWSLVWTQALASGPNSSTPKLTAIAPGVLKITNSNSGVVGATSVTIAAAAEATPAEPPAAAPAPPPDVALLEGNLPDGTVVNVTAARGQRVPITADQTHGLLVYYTDGMCAALDHSYYTSTTDLTGTFTLTVNGVVLLDGAQTVRLRTCVPFWTQQPPVLANPDLSMFPNYSAGSSGATLSATAAWDPAMSDEGERMDLSAGGVDKFSAAYLCNPTAANAAVIFALANSCAQFAFRATDPATNAMVDMSANPKICYDPDLAGQGLVPKITTAASTYNLSEAAAHAPTFYALAAAIFGTDYHKNGLSHWANYVGSIWQNWSYRLPCGYTSHAHGQTRGKGRALTVALYAAKLSDNPAYFDAWAKAAGLDMQATWSVQTGIAVDQHDAVYLPEVVNGATVYYGYGTYQQDILIAAIGQALDFGYSDGYQWTLDYLGGTLIDSLTKTPCELSTYYSPYYKSPVTNAIVADWSGAMTLSATYDTKLAAALLCAEGSQALQTAMGWTTPPGSFDGHPTAPTGYAAMKQPALAALVNHATDQTGANAAWAKFTQYALPIINYSAEPGYNLVPRIAAAA